VEFVLIGLFAAAACIAANAFFVAAEFAFVSIRHTWVDELVQQGNKRAAAVKAMVDRLDDAIAATQLGITIASIALGWLGEPALARVVEPLLVRVLPVWHHAAAHTIATVLAFAGITFLHVILGELAPKAVALGTPEKVALLTVRPLSWFGAAFRPVIWSMNHAGGWVVRRLGLAPPEGHVRIHSVRELKQLVAESHDAGDLDPTQAAVVSRALSIKDTRVREVMVPRERMTTLDLEMTESEILEAIDRAQHSRMPVRSRAENRIVGIGNIKLLLLRYVRDGHVDLPSATFQEITFHHAAPVTRALRMFQRRHQHMGLVAGDDGEILGVVTLEDVLEEVVGEIEDELDVEIGTLRRPFGEP
jgi:CBS domain containing-hemolysin-like protein